MPKGMSVQSLLYLRSAFKRPEAVKMLTHMDQINAAALGLVTTRKWQPYLTPRLLDDVSRDDDPLHGFYHFNAILGDTLKMAEESHWQRCPRQFCSS